MSLALRSGIFVSAISVSCLSVIVPTTSLPVVWAPLSRPAAARRSTGVGGVLVMNVNVRSSKIVISTGTIVPRWPSVWLLYILQKSMMLTPWGPRAVPTGGAGVAAPAGIWILTIAAMRRLAMRFLLPGGPGGAGGASHPVWLELRHLAELELDRCLPAEDVAEALQAH